MDLPPPPPQPLPPPGVAPAPAGGHAWTPPVPAPPGGGVLGGAWRWTLGIGWCLILSGLGALAQSAFLVDADPWWLRFKPLPFALPVAVLLALVSDSRWTLPLSAAAAAVLVVLALVDTVNGNPAVAVGEGVCALSAVLLTAGAVLGRERRAPAPEPGAGA